MTKRYECIVCGRVFYEGQGITMVLSGRELVFHSKTCALKFFRSLVLYLDQRDLENAVKLAAKEYEEKLKDLREKTKKSIEKL